ncbi:MAG: branched-chain amino acid ABC transporter permease [Actinomycetota bacterium]
MFPITVKEGGSQHKLHQMIAWGVLAVILVVLPFIIPEFQVSRVNRVMFLAIAILGLNLVLGYGGLLALGHSAFIGLGAFITTWLVQDMNWDYWMTIPVSMFACFIFGGLLALPAIRIRGLYLALITIALATVFPSLAKIEAFGIADATGGANGREIDEKVLPPGWAESIGFSIDEPSRYRYFLILLATIIAFWAVSNLLKSRAGRAIVAIRDNETGAAVSGVDLVRWKLLNFAISASLGGLAGVLWAMDRAFVAEQGFGFLLAVELLVGLVIGGVATVPGAVVGAFVVVFVREFTKGLQIPLGFTTIDGEGPLSQAIYGGILVIVTFFAPGGLIWMFRLLRSKVYRVIPQPPELSEPVTPLGAAAAEMADA